MHIVVTRLHDNHRRRLPLKHMESLTITRDFVSAGRKQCPSDKYVTRRIHAYVTRIRNRLYLRPMHDNAPVLRGPLCRPIHKFDIVRIDGRVVRFSNRHTSDLHFEVDDDTQPESLPPTPPKTVREGRMPTY